MALSSGHIEDCLALANEDVNLLYLSILKLNLDANKEKLIITNINQLLSTSRTRPKGFEFLNVFLNDLSVPIILENYAFWLNHCVIKYNGDVLREIKLTIVGKLVEDIHAEQDFTKKFISDYMYNLLDSCLKTTHLKSCEIEAALNALIICMKSYASWFAPHRSKIEDFLLVFLDNTRNSPAQLVKKAALAFHYLQQTGGSGADAINHRTNFSNKFHKLCGTVHKLFDTFFENEREIFNYGMFEEESFEFQSLPCDSKKMQQVTASRINNCLEFLLTMIKTNYPVAKEIKPKRLLDVINRGTAIHHCLTKENDNSLIDYQFSLLLNRIQINLLKILQYFASWYQANAMPFSYSINKILVDCLNRSQSCKCFKHDSLYQEAIYKALNQWIRIAKNAVHEHFQTQLINCILNDFTPIKTGVTLTLQNNTNQNKSAEAKRKEIKERIISSGQKSNSRKITLSEKLSEENNCKFALSTLKQLLISTTLKVKPTILNNMYSAVVNTLLDQQTSKIAHPYTNPQCQAALYDVLVALFNQDSLKILPRLQTALDILLKGANNDNRFIANTCEQGLHCLEKLCQPICPSLCLGRTDIGVEREEELINVKNLVIEYQENSENGMEDDTVESDMAENSIDNINGHSEDQISQNKNTSETKTVEIIDIQIIKSPKLLGNESKEQESSNVEDALNDKTDTTEENGENISAKNIIAVDRTSGVQVSPRSILKALNSEFEKNNEQHRSSSIFSRDTVELIILSDDEQPPTKKAKEDDSEAREEKSEIIKKHEAVDDCFIEDDSFVDEVKDY